MSFDDSSLDAKYHLVKLSVLSSTQISSRTSAVLSNLQQPQDPSNALATPSPIVALTAKAHVGTKLISIAEIAKRELAANGVKCFQYNALSSQMIEVEREKKKPNDADEDESDDAFETMGAGQLSAMKKRKVPVMTIYLATTSVKQLKSAFGEQT